MGGVPAAAAGADLDVLDGYVARLDTRRQSRLGADLDSLADVISFGVAPAVLGFTLGLRGGWDMLLLTYFVVCGVSRLARFNVTAAALADASTGKVKYFEGTPIPTSIAIVLLLGVAFYLGRIDEALWLGASASARPPTSAVAHLRHQRQRDDQRDAAYPEARDRCDGADRLGAWCPMSVVRRATRQAGILLCWAATMSAAQTPAPQRSRLRSRLHQEKHQRRAGRQRPPAPGRNPHHRQHGSEAVHQLRRARGCVDEIEGLPDWAFTERYDLPRSRQRVPPESSGWNVASDARRSLEAGRAHRGARA